MKYHYVEQNKETAYQGFFKLNRYLISFEKFSGGMVENVWRECSEKGDIVAVLPYDPSTQEILLVEQFRIGMMVRGIHPWTLEIVAGFMDVDGETPEVTAARELKEETGCDARAITKLTQYFPGPGGSASQIHVFLAEVDAPQAQQCTGLESEGEDIRVHTIPALTVKELLRSQKINNATAIIALQHFFMASD